jgi:hypothetical protein
MKEADIILEELQICLKKIPQQILADFIDQISQAKRIFVYGTGRSGLMLKALAMRLMQLDYEVYVIGETITPAVQREDLLIVASASGETESVCAAARNAVRHQTKILAITAASKSTLTGYVKPFLTVETGSKSSRSKESRQPLGSLFEQMLLLFFDCATYQICQGRKDGNTHMANRHASIE